MVPAQVGPLDDPTAWVILQKQLRETNIQKQPFGDVSHIQNGNFPANHVSLLNYRCKISF